MNANVDYLLILLEELSMLQTVLILPKKARAEG
jgi:hypothetical protein